MSSEERQVIDYFIVAGLPDNPIPLKDLPQKSVKLPIVDVMIINKSQGETPPDHYQCIDITPSGYPANLNHGSVLAPEMFLCYQRGLNKPPIIDLGVMYSGKESPKFGCQVLTHTPYGRSANVNNTGGEKIYVTYIRADEAADSDSLAVVDICVILPGKNESPPHAFRRIDKNLNKGMLGSDVFLCYKKSIVKNNSLNYEAGMLFRYPTEDLPDFPLPQQVAMFCLPFGATIESWPPGARHPLPIFSTFVLTGATGEKVYGAAVIFYEEHDQSTLKSDQKMSLGLVSAKKKLSIHQNQSISILSRWPFFDTFKKFLLTLYRISVSGPQLIPLERHIGHFMSQVPFPTRERPRILVQLSTESVTLLLPEETPLPKSGASFIKMLMNLGPDNIISLLFYVLMEHRILIHSLRPDLLTSVAEAVVSMIFPFHWQCPYIPLCPLQISALLDSPTPFIIGLDSRYFDTFDPPPDITFVDLDTCTINVSEERRNHSASLLPKRSVKILRSTLEELYEQFIGDSSHPSTPDELDRHGVLSTHAFKGIRKLEMLEMSIQEAFLRFMANILKDYEKFLLPVAQAPKDASMTAVDSLFNIQGFLSSREKASRSFYRLMLKTQYFSRFIDERSFVSDENIGLAFFDECIKKLDNEDRGGCVLLEFDETSALSERTVFILPPEPPSSPSGVMFSYKGFTQLQPGLFTQQPQKQDVLRVSSANSLTTGSILRRTKQELKCFQKALAQFSDQAEPMAKCFLWVCYSLWFMCFPAHIQSIPSKVRSLEEALAMLRQMHKLQMQPLDEVCYRILMHLCCVYNHPIFAVKIYHEMKQNQIHPNAITYGFYNKAVVDSRWSSSVTASTQTWTKLRNILFATVKLRALYQERKLRRCDNNINPRESDLSLLPNGGVPEGIIPSSVPLVDTERAISSHPISDTPDASDHRVTTVHSEPEINSESSRESQASLCDSQNEELTDESKSLTRGFAVLTPVTENDPLGVFGKKDGGRNNLGSGANHQQLELESHSEGAAGGVLNFTSAHSAGSANSCAVAGAVSSKCKSCDELTSNQLEQPPANPSLKTRRRGSFEGKEKAGTADIQDNHAKTLSRLDKLKAEEASRSSLPRTGSFGSAWHSAVTLLNSTYQNLRDSLSTGNSSQNIDSVIDISTNSDLLPLPLQTEQRAHSAGNLSFEHGMAAVEKKQTHGNLATDSGSSIECDSTDYHHLDKGSSVDGNNLAFCVEAHLCTQSKCPNCTNLLHDEELMAGWSPNESNLQTRCLCCGYNFVPTIQVTLRDFRGSSATMTTSDEQTSLTESELSLSTASSSLHREANERKDSMKSGSLTSRGSDLSDGSSIGRLQNRETKNKTFSVDINSDVDQKLLDFEQNRCVSDAVASLHINDNGSRDQLKRRCCRGEESLNFPYLSPLVLKKEMENLVELRGEDCLNKPGLIEDHPIIFWNLVWYFRRLDLPSYLNSFILNSAVFSNNKCQESESLTAEKNCPIIVRTLWNGMQFHKEYGLPMYILWRDSEKTATDNDEVMVFSKSFLRSILIYLSRYDIQSAIEEVLSERKRIHRKGKVLYRSIYYDLLFLALSVLGNKFKTNLYDSLYRTACNDLSPVFNARLMEADRPPRMSTIRCRQLFGRLEL